MRKLMLLMAFVLLTGLVHGKGMNNKPDCGSVGDVLKKAKEEGIKNIISMDYVDGKWIVETIDKSGHKKSHIIHCNKCDVSKKKKVYAHKVTAPPKGKTVGEIISIAKKENQGNIDEVKFVDGIWAVSISKDDVDTEVIYDTSGKKLRTMTIK